MGWGDVLKSLILWGPGAVIAGVIIFVLYKLTTNIGLKFIDVGREQAQALAKQAHGMEGLRDAIQAFVNRDNQEHRDMMVMLRVIVDRLERRFANEVTVNERCKDQRSYPRDTDIGTE